MDKLQVKSEKVILDTSLEWNPLTPDVVVETKTLPNIENYTPNKVDDGMKEGKSDDSDSDQTAFNKDMEKVNLSQFAMWGR